MILMNDFKSEPGHLHAAILTAVERVVSSGWYVLGPEVERFEMKWAEMLGSRFAVGVGNGMDAIELALRALGIGPGDEVITTPLTAFATVLAVIRSGATPVLADIDPATGLLDPNSAQRCLSSRTRAILPVHLYGQIRDMQRWTELCEQAGVSLIEDCAQAHLARWNGRSAGQFGRAGAYSFYPTKNLGCLGDGGALVTEDPKVAAQAACLRNYGQSERYRHTEIGMNSRLDEIQAAILVERLEYLMSFTRRRREIAASYQSKIINPAITLPAPPQEMDAHVYHLYVIRTTSRAALQEHLRLRGIQSLIHYPIPVHLQAPCRDLRVDPRGLREAEQHAQECLSIPCHPQLTDKQVEAIVNALNEFAP